MKLDARALKKSSPAPEKSAVNALNPGGTEKRRSAHAAECVTGNGVEEADNREYRRWAASRKPTL